MIYCLFGYPNKSRKRKGSLLARCRDLVSLQLFLAGSKINLHVVDIQILKKYFDSIYEQKEFDLGLDFEPTYRLGHRQLASLSDYSGISAIGLSRNEVEIRNYNILVPIEVGLVKSIAETKVVTVLPPKLSKKINSSLLRNSQLNLNI